MRFDFPHLSYHSTDSTNLQALNYLSKTSPQTGFMIISDYQTAGKGQFGRNWESESSLNLLCSFIFGPLNWSLDRLFNLHLISAISVLQMLEESDIPDLSIKWPNDIYSGVHKMGGILIQNIIRENNLLWTVVGIGINVNQTTFSAGLNATSMSKEKGRQFSVDEIATRLREILLNMFQAKDNLEEEWLQQYNAFLYSKDQWKTIRKTDGDSFTGKIRSVSKAGNLIVEKQNGEFLNLQHGEANIEW